MRLIRQYRHKSNTHQVAHVTHSVAWCRGAVAKLTVRGFRPHLSLSLSADQIKPFGDPGAKWSATKSEALRSALSWRRPWDNVPPRVLRPPLKGRNARASPIRPSWILHPEGTQLAPQFAVALLSRANAFSWQPHPNYWQLSCNKRATQDSMPTKQELRRLKANIHNEQRNFRRSQVREIKKSSFCVAFFELEKRVSIFLLVVWLEPVNQNWN